VLGLNARNLSYVHGMNRREHFPLADDKVRTKELLESAGVPVPVTLAVLSNLVEVNRARTALERTTEFVLKPTRGRQGGGIVVVIGRQEALFELAGGSRLDWEGLRRAMADILFGVHTSGRADRVLVEKLIRPHPDLGGLAGAGLPDVRVILLKGDPAMAMMRVPTRASAGRANLHRGAAGVALRLSDGLAFRCLLEGREAGEHPESGAPLVGFRVPMWPAVLDVARRAAASLPLPFLGVDIVLTAGGPLVMEVNVRPGLEIQNVNRRGLRRRLEAIDGSRRRDAREAG
ncbi:MAG TPA: sugar-transfer associated ATP-grasp domain-containing protein, partial [Candidatus Polarisedimenticolia bacterium]|nr:sugar-transfer associated ATP-grasp domain-containing protein [Candidatus Polarisedimenticolia bacterium]